MRSPLPEKLEQGRVTTGEYATWHGAGPYGQFKVMGPCGEQLRIVASGADFKESKGWEHVSVSTRRRIPNWTEMCFVKDLFWDDEETVVQFHPPKSEYVTNHPNVLHLWRNINFEFQRPPYIMVGVKSLGELKPGQAAELRRVSLAGGDEEAAAAEMARRSR